MSNRNRPHQSGIFRLWRSFFLRRSGPKGIGRLAARLAGWGTGPYHQRAFLAEWVRRGYFSPKAFCSHPDLRLGEHVYIGDNVVITSTRDGGSLELADRVHLYGDTFLSTGLGGSIRIGARTHVQPGCHIHAYLSEIHIGEGVEIAAGCAFYNYDHGMDPGVEIMRQPLTSKGGICVGAGAWLGHGVTVLQGVTIGTGAVIAAGAVVVRDIPENAIAAGVPARVIRYRTPPGETPDPTPTNTRT